MPLGKGFLLILCPEADRACSALSWWCRGQDADFTSQKLQVQPVGLVQWTSTSEVMDLTWLYHDMWRGSEKYSISGLDVRSWRMEASALWRHRWVPAHPWVPVDGWKVLQNLTENHKWPVWVSEFFRIEQTASASAKAGATKKVKNMKIWTSFLWCWWFKRFNSWKNR